MLAFRALAATTLVTVLWLVPVTEAQCSPQSNDPCCILTTGSIAVTPSVSFPVAVTSLVKVRACLRGIQRLPQSVKTAVVESLRLKLVNIYAFLDIARDSTKSNACPGVPYNIHKLSYDALAALQATLQESSTMGFYQALSAVFRGFNDAHTRFFSPLQAFHYIRPMVLTTRLANGLQNVYFSRINPLYSLLGASKVAQIPIAWKDFIGRRIYKINGVDALTYLENQADSFGFHKSRGVRFNQLLKQTYFSLGEHDLPANDNETYTLDDGSEVVAPLVAVVTDPRLTNGGTSQVSNFMASRTNSVINAIKLSNILDASLEYTNARSLAPQIATWDLKPLSISYEDLVLVFEVDNALVIKLPGEFDTSPSNGLFRYAVQTVFLKATAYAKTKKINTILIDVIGTNGGQVTLSNWLLGALVPQYQTNDLSRCVTYDFKTAPAWDRWVEAFGSQHWVNAINHNLTYEQVEEIFEMVVTRQAEFSALFDPGLSSFYQSIVEPRLIKPLKRDMNSSGTAKQLADVRKTLTSLFTGQPYSFNTHYVEWYPMVHRNRPTAGVPGYADVAYYRQPVQYMRGGTTATYTQRFFQDCFTTMGAKEKAGMWSSVQAYFTNIMFLTDGTCGGACALLLSKLQLDGKAKVATLGGIYKAPMDTSFAGGYIEDWPEEFEKIRLSEFLGKLIFSSANASTFPELDKLPISATYTLAAYEMYIASLGQCALPRDWYNIPGDYHIDEWATQLDAWPTPDHDVLLQLYRKTITAIRPTPPPTPPATTPYKETGLSGGALTGVLIGSAFVAVILALVLYVHIRKMQRKPLLPNDSRIESTPMLDDTVSLNGPESWQDDTQ